MQRSGAVHATGSVAQGGRHHGGRDEVDAEDNMFLKGRVLTQVKRQKNNKHKSNLYKLPKVL